MAHILRVQAQYDRLAPQYDRMEGPLDALFLRRHRQSLMALARGHVLEVAIGTGKNLPYYPAECRITGIDLSQGMLRIAESRARRLGRTVALSLMHAETLGFPDHSFDTVVTSLSLCTIPDPEKALTEMRRVCKKDGQILLLEHVRSHHRFIGKVQDWLTPGQVRRMGCHLNRELAYPVAAAGLKVNRAASSTLGIIAIVHASP